jgi:putative ubiquitin-RnfH superfamily antitoxin RatB of RatAB toxin-antitoxin module
MGEYSMDNITVEITYALPEQQTLLTFTIPDNSTIKDGIVQSGILQKHPELNVDDMLVGIFGKKAPMEQTLRDKDRIEIYRPLIADPKEVRKRKAAEGKQLKKGGAKA